MASPIIKVKSHGLEMGQVNESSEAHDGLAAWQMAINLYHAH
jgi:hypothetical protein